MVRRPFAGLSDSSLRAKIRSVVAVDRRTTVELLLVLDEIDRRHLYRDDGFPSLFRYCVDPLGMSEDVAYKRIRAARAGRRFPVLFEAIADGRLHLAAVVLLAPHLTAANLDDLLSAASHRCKKQIELLLAERFPQKDVATVVRALPTHATPIGMQLAPGPVGNPGAAQSPAVRPDAMTPEPFPATPEALAPGPVAPPRPATVAPLSPRRFALQVTIAQATHDRLRRAQDLIGFGSRDVATVLDRALALLVAELEKRKFAATGRPRVNSPSPANPRTISAEVKRSVFARDGGRCTYVSPSGRHCDATSDLEFDHRIPLAHGGTSDVSNVRLLCRPHNQMEAERVLGVGLMDRRRAAGRNTGEPGGPSIAPDPDRLARRTGLGDRETGPHPRSLPVEADGAGRHPRIGAPPASG